MPAADLRLLVLDGDGVRGLSSLMILRRLMAAVDPDGPPNHHRLTKTHATRVC